MNISSKIKQIKLIGLSLIPLLILSCGNDGGDAVVDPDPVPNPADILIESPDEISPDQPFAITNVSIITMNDESVLENQTLLIENGVIKELGTVSEVSIPSNYEVIDAQNKGYLIPGLMDMHYHRSTGVDLFLYVLNGVTTIREMWGSVGFAGFAQRVLDENLNFPRIFVASSGMDGPGGPFEQITDPVTTTEQARGLVRQYKEDGYHFIKVYNLLTNEIYHAIIDEAKIQNIPVVGHVPFDVPTADVFRAGQASTEHFLGYGYEASSSNAITNGTMDKAKIGELAQISIENGVWHVPTITVDAQSESNILSTQQSEEYRLISQELKNNFESFGFRGFSNPEQSKINHQETLFEIHQMEGNIMLGTDAGFGYILPGFSVHDELELYIEAGLSNFEALQTATVNPASFLQMEDKIGRIAQGMEADLVLLEANPLENIRATEDRAGVVLRGRWISQSNALSFARSSVGLD